MSPISFFIEPDTVFPSSVPLYAQTTLEQYVKIGRQWNDFHNLKKHQDIIRTNSRSLSKKSLALLDKSRRYTQEAMDYLETCLARTEPYVVTVLDQMDVYWVRRSGDREANFSSSSEC